MKKPKPAATARYSRYVVVEFNKSTEAKEFFYQLGEQMGFDPRNRKYPPGTSLEWATRQLSRKHAKKLTRAP